MTAIRLELPTPDGPMPVFEVAPDRPPAGGVVVIQDVFGVTPYLEGVASDLAGLGWHALAPHLYHRLGSPVVPFDRFPEAEGYLRTLTGPGILADLDACLARLATVGIGVSVSAVIGFCMGGTVAYFAATARQIGAAVTFYGQLGSSGWPGVAPAVDSVDRLQAPWLGLFGSEDPLVPAEQVDEMAKLVGEVDTPTQVLCYRGAGHAFHRSSTPDTYHPEAASLAWDECTRWLGRHLSLTKPDPEHPLT